MQQVTEDQYDIDHSNHRPCHPLSLAFVEKSSYNRQFSLPSSGCIHLNASLFRKYTMKLPQLTLLLLPATVSATFGTFQQVISTESGPSCEVQTSSPDPTDSNRVIGCFCFGDNGCFEGTIDHCPAGFVWWEEIISCA